MPELPLRRAGAPTALDVGGSGTPSPPVGISWNSHSATAPGGRKSPTEDSRPQPRTGRLPAMSKPVERPTHDTAGASRPGPAVRPAYPPRPSREELQAAY